MKNVGFREESGLGFFFVVVVVVVVVVVAVGLKPRPDWSNFLPPSCTDRPTKKKQKKKETQ